MKLRLLPISSFAIALALAACQRAPNSAELDAERRRNEQLRALDDKIAQLQDLERQATERKIEESEKKASEGERKAAESERERQRLEKERQNLLRERDRLADAQKTAQDKADAAERKAAESARRADQERQERTFDLFYTALDPHGEWIEVDRYGYVWQPNSASDPRWRPYTDGRWVFTDYGWTWKSNEPFGWATYHYGRWTRLRRLGWIWVPGTEWGPGWVSWRRSDRFVGWAPLPPEAWSGSGFNQAVDSYYDIGPGSYTFVPVEEIGEQTYVGRAVEPEKNVTIVNQTVNVTNITYTKVQNNTVVFNGGPTLADVNARAAQKVPRLQVERVTDVRSPKDLGRAEQRGNTLIVAAPEIAKEETPSKPLRVKERMKAPELDRGWTDLDRSAADAARARMTKEARDAEEKQRKSASVKETQADGVDRTSATPPSEANKEKPPRSGSEERSPSPATPGSSRPSELPKANVESGRDRSPGPRGPEVPARESSTPAPRVRVGATPQPNAATPAPANAATPASPQERGERPARPAPGAEAGATPAPRPAGSPASGAEAPAEPRGPRPPRLRPVDAPTGAATTPAAGASNQRGTPAGIPAVVPGTPAEPTPDRRLPKAKRPRPVTAATPPAQAGTQEVPTATPALKRGRQTPSDSPVPSANQ